MEEKEPNLLQLMWVASVMGFMVIPLAIPFLISVMALDYFSSSGEALAESHWVWLWAGASGGVLFERMRTTNSSYKRIITRSQADVAESKGKSLLWKFTDNALAIVFV